MSKVDVVTKWIYPMSDKAIKEKIENLAKDTGLSISECSILYNRHFRTKEEIKLFLNVSLADLRDPYKMNDIVLVAKTIIKYLKAGKRIVLYSDYDADGFGCVIVFVKLMRKLGYHIDYYTNTRDMGYGIKPECVDALVEKYPDVELIVTADNGIVGFEGIDHAVKDLGIEVCVTDHHAPDSKGRLPECTGVVNPNRLDSTYEFKGLCGTAVIFKLCQVIYQELGKNPKACNELLDIVALATIADVVPLLDENRAMVKEGLDIMNKESKNIWKYMRELLMNSQFETSVTAKTIGFSYGPSINACSRLLGNMDIPIQTFLYEDAIPANEELIKAGIIKMRDINKERKDLSENQTAGVMGMVSEEVESPVFVIWHEELHEGIVGIIAGRVCERFNKPTIVLTNSKENPHIWKGSGRSIPGFNIKEVMDQIQEEDNVLIGYGGHEGACGVTVSEDNLEAFKISMILKGDELLDVSAKKEIVVDVALEDKDYVVEMYDQMKSLEPFGQGFKSPVYGIKNFNPEYANGMGGDNKDKHVKFVGKNIDYLGWNCYEDWNEDGCKKENLSVIGELSVNTYRDVTKLQLSTREYADIQYLD